MVMRELLRSIFDCISSLKTQLCAAVSIPLSDPAQREECELVTTDGMLSDDFRPSIGESFKCVEHRPGYLTRNGRGSLQIGAALDD